MTSRKFGFILAIVAAAAFGVACGSSGGSGNKDGSVAIDSGSVIDGSTAVDSSTPADSGPQAQDGATSCSPTVAAKDVTVFCTDFGRICGFSAAGYATMDACVASYGGTNTTNKMCRTYHLCNSSLPGGVAAGHCAHAAAAPGNGQCM